jgi:hypothetical protein
LVPQQVENETKGRGGLNFEKNQILNTQGKKNENFNKLSQGGMRILKETGK